MSAITSTMDLTGTVPVGAVPVGAEPAVLTERDAHRWTGIRIAVGASLALWAAVGAGVWGVVSLVS